MFNNSTQVCFLSILLATLLPYFAKSQSDTLQQIDIQAVTISASRVSEKAIRLPLPVTKFDFTKSQDVRQQLSFNEYLSEVPGLFALNANNFAQDLRVSIRGFGARSAFGIRGIKILVDGVPETTPDGQGQIDNLNLGIIQNIEVIRGPSSALYGNASGGVISISTLNNFTGNYLQAGTTLGAFNMQQYQLTSGIKSGNTRYILQGSYTSSNGYREHSNFKNTNLNARAIHQLSKKSELSFQFNYVDSPTANDAGSLDLEAVTADQKQALDRNVAFDAGEAISQYKLAANFKHDFNPHNQFNTFAFISIRDFFGNLPFEPSGAVDLSRAYFGYGGNYQLEQIFQNGANKIMAGYDLAHQGDTRLRFDNLNGTKGELVFDQIETFNSIAGYLIDHLTIGKWLIMGGLRYDYNQLVVNDRFTSNGNSSSKKNYRKYNPNLNISYSLSGQNSIYTGFSTSFETPALSELSANPNGGDGFNRSLQPQRARNYEIGFKTRNKKGDQQLEIALFHIDTEQDIVPFELDSFPGRTFFRNAASSRRNGLEVEFYKNINRSWRIQASYTLSDFEYVEYDTLHLEYEGNTLPGIPKHMVSTSLSYSNNGLYCRLQGRFNGMLYTSDSNDVSDEGYLLVNLNLGYKIEKEKITLTPFFGINNLLDTKYNDNIRINAFGGRYYEPAPGVNIFGGVRVRI